MSRVVLYKNLTESVVYLGNCTSPGGRSAQLSDGAHPLRCSNPLADNQHKLRMRYANSSKQEPTLPGSYPDFAFEASVLSCIDMDKSVLAYSRCCRWKIWIPSTALDRRFSCGCRAEFKIGAPIQSCTWWLIRITPRCSLYLHAPHWWLLFLRSDVTTLQVGAACPSSHPAQKRSVSI